MIERLEGSHRGSGWILRSARDEETHKEEILL